MNFLSKESSSTALLVSNETVLVSMNQKETAQNRALSDTFKRSELPLMMSFAKRKTQF